MPFIAIIIGAILIVAAFQGTHRTLATNLEQDIPGFFKWGIAIVVILALGYVPGLRTPTRWLLGLVALVVLLTQYQNIISGFKNFAATGQSTAQQSAQSETQAAQTATAQTTQIQTAMMQAEGPGSGFGGNGASTLSSLAQLAPIASAAFA